MRVNGLTAHGIDARSRVRFTRPITPAISNVFVCSRVLLEAVVSAERGYKAQLVVGSKVGRE